MPCLRAETKTVRHFLLECPGYAHEQWALEKQLSRRKKEMTLENILGDAEAIVPLTNYINASYRFMYPT